MGKCYQYINEQARKQAKGNSCAVRDDVVYEWAEDYYHKDDKAEEEEKTKAAKKAKEEGKKCDEIAAKAKAELRRRPLLNRIRIGQGLIMTQRSKPIQIITS